MAGANENLKPSSALSTTKEKISSNGHAEKKEPEMDINTSSVMESRFAAIVADAAKLHAGSSGDAIRDFMTPRMKTVEELQKQIEIHNERFSHFRERRQRIFHAVSLAFRPIELVGEMVAGPASEVFAPAQSIHCAVMYLINAAKDVSSAYDSIIELFEQLKDFTSRLDVYLKHELSAALKEKLVTILGSLFEVLVIATNEVRRGRFKAYFKRLVGSESPVQPAVEKLRALTLGEERQVLAETYGGVAQINIKTDRVADLVDEVNQRIKELRTEYMETTTLSQQDRLKDILEPSPFPEDFYSAFTKFRVPDTGDWILQDEGLQAWLKGETRHLWICGSPGTGKSFLTSRLISWGLSYLPHVAYFYFRDTNPETRSVIQALRDLAYQLSESDATYAKSLLRRLHSSDEIRTVASAFRRLFIQPFENATPGSKIYVFLDGIDEAAPDEIEQLLSILAPDEDMTQQEPLKIQFALTGRSYMTDTVVFALDPAAQGHVYTTIYITPDRVAADVSAFIYEGVMHSRVLSRTSADFKYEVIGALERQVDGLFILAKFMLSDINRKRHPRSILKSLDEYPKEINGMLHRTIENLSNAISKEAAEDLNEMLRWVACAEEALTLQHLEAILTLRFGDLPVRLEETIRGQYACFFDLERQDGLTTDDLVKEHERRSRESSKGLGIASHMSPGRRLSSTETMGPGRRVSPASIGSPVGKGSPNTRGSSAARGRPTRGSPRIGASSRGSSPVAGPFSPVRQFSPARSPDIDPVNDIEFTSNKLTTYITFFHSSIRQYFRENYSYQDPEQPAGTSIGFDTTLARIHILRTCLRIFNDKEWFGAYELGQGMESIKQYAAWYWQEHLAVLDPATVPPAVKRELGVQIYKMITDHDMIFEWSIMYEKNNEGLEVLTDRNIQALCKWMSDPDVVASVGPDAGLFSTGSKLKPVDICREVGRFYAKAWVSDSFAGYVPTLFCFKIVQNVAFMDDGYEWSHANIHWSEFTIEERILKATEWAKYPQTARWHRRVGSTYLTQGMHGFALSHYDQALKLDKDSVETYGRIAFCLYQDERFDDALERGLECIALEEKGIAHGGLKGKQLRESKWRLYRDHYLVAQCYYFTDRVHLSLEYFKKAIRSAGEVKLSSAEYFEAETAYLQVLSAENLHGEMMELLQRMSQQITGNVHGQSRLIDFFLHQYNHKLVLDLIPKAACKTDKVTFLLDRLELAVETAHGLRDPLRVLYLRLSFGTVCAHGHLIEDAIDIFEQISLVEFRPRGNIMTRQGHAVSFQKLATLYKQEVLRAGLNSPEAENWIAKLEFIHEKQSTHQNMDMPVSLLGSDANVASAYLALFYRLLNRDEESWQLLKTVIIDSLEIVSDEEPENDEFALENLLRAFIAADDMHNAQALAQSMRKLNPKASFHTPTESPTFVLAVDPKLPEIQSATRGCAQCLNNISLSEDFVVCRYCMDYYCITCLQDVIKQPGNTIADQRPDVVCSSDHDWFTVPPLNRSLHRGEILSSGGQVQSFEEWKEMLQEQWDREVMRGREMSDIDD